MSRPWRSGPHPVSGFSLDLPSALIVVGFSALALGVWLVAFEQAGVDDRAAISAESDSDAGAARSLRPSSSSASDEEAVPTALAWAPPSLDDPDTIELTSGAQTVELDRGRDYVLEFPDRPIRGAVRVVGGRNIVIIGGEVFIPWQGEEPSIQSRRALYFRGQTGTVHIEGLLLGGDDLTEGIQIDAPEAVVQIQNVRVEQVTARDLQEFSDNHPDVLQPFGGVEELRVDRLTGYTDYQGLFLVGSLGPIGAADLRNTNVVGSAVSRYLLWYSGDFELDIQRVYAEPAPGRSWEESVWHPPDWVGALEGRPPEGDFVLAGDVGVVYASPGYDGNG